MAPSPPGALGDASRRGVRLLALRHGELRGVVLAFLYFFFLLTGYYVLRPLREEKLVAAGVGKLPWLFSATFLVMLVVVPAWTALVSRVSRRRLLPLTYHFFALQIVAFFALLRWEATRAAATHAFFVWLSVFNLIVVAVFWSFMADLFREDQGKRLFGLIAAGGSAGALLGPTLTATLVGRLGTERLLLVAAALIEAAAICVVLLLRWDRRRPPEERPTGQGTDPDAPVGGGVVSGLRAVLTTPLLLAAAGYLLFATLLGTFDYALNARAVAEVLGDPAARTRWFARLDLFGNLLTLGLQALVAGRLLTRVGVTPIIAVLPLVAGLGFGAVAMAPTLGVIAVYHVIRRAAAYGLSNPTFGVVFTVVDREQKYKARAFIDTIVYRGGDVIGAWLFTGLLGLGLGQAGAAGVAVALSVPWLALALLVGRRHGQRAATRPGAL